VGLCETVFVAVGSVMSIVFITSCVDVVVVSIVSFSISVFKLSLSIGVVSVEVSVGGGSMLVDSVMVGSAVVLVVVVVVVVVVVLGFIGLLASSLLRLSSLSLLSHEREGFEVVVIREVPGGGCTSNRDSLMASISINSSKSASAKAPSLPGYGPKYCGVYAPKRGGCG
jgi:hypothetical protein